MTNRFHLLLARKDDVKKEALSLIDCGLLLSAENVLSLYLSSFGELRSGTETENFHFSIAEAEINEILGDVSVRRRQHKRAQVLFRKSLSCYQYFCQKKDGLFTAPLSYSGNSSTKGKNQPKLPSFSSSTALVDAARLKYKICLCQIKISPKDHAAVIRELETIPSKCKDVKIHLLLGNLYKASNLRRLAIKSYKEALVIFPSSTEIVDALLSMGVDPVEVSSTTDDGFKAKQTATDALEDITSAGWMKIYVMATASKRDYDIENSISCWKKLMEHFPKNAFLMRRTAVALLLSAPLTLSTLTSDTIAATRSAATRCHFGGSAISSNEIAAAQQLLSQVRRDDALTLDGMDLLARILYQKEDAVELNKLANDSLEACDTRPEGWLAAAMFCALKGEMEKASTFVDKAIQMDPKHSDSFKAKGQLHLQQSNFEQALISFSQANSLEHDISSFYGMLQANIAMGKLKDAISVAKEAVALLPKSTCAYLMMGIVLAQSSQGVVESVRAFGKALKIDPWNRTAASNMADALCSQGKCEEAVECLSSVLAKCSCRKTRLQLAKVYSKMGKYKDAIENLHLSIGMDPKDSIEAVQEMDRIEGLLRGDNYDRQDEEDGGEEEEEDDDDDDEEDDNDDDDAEDGGEEGGVDDGRW